jgi:hypothetical protein
MHVGYMKCINILLLRPVWKGHVESCVHRLEVKVCLPIMYCGVL